MEVIVYHGNRCRVCHEEMEYLKHKNVPFIAKNVHTDPEARKELIALGSKTIPTTVIGAEIIVGFEVERIKALVGIIVLLVAEFVVFPNQSEARVTLPSGTSDIVRLTSFSHGGGCGCKIAPGLLADILRTTGGYTIPPQLLVGIETGDDAAVYQIDDNLAIVATTDFFMPIVDDPFDFGQLRRPMPFLTCMRWVARRSWPWQSSACRSTGCRLRTFSEF